MKKAVGIICAIMMVARITGLVALASSYTTYKVVNNEAILYQTNDKNFDVTIPENFEGRTVVAIGTKAYKDSETLNNISLPNTIEWIETQAFYNCTDLEEINIPDGVKKIEKETFYNCTSLENIVLPSGLCMIEEGAFEKSGLTEVEIPKSVKAIEDLAFADCQNLEKVTIYEGTQIADNAFEGSPNVTIVVK